MHVAGADHRPLKLLKNKRKICRTSGLERGRAQVSDAVQTVVRPLAETAGGTRVPRRRRIAWQLAWLLFVGGGAAALDLPFFGGGNEPEAGEDLWAASEQYVRLVNREEGAVTSNAHPVAISRQELYDALAGLKAVQKSRWLSYTSKKPVPVFSPGLLDVLAKHLSEGLARATPEQELVFVIIGAHKGDLYFSESKATGGRVFYGGERLQIIFGDLLRSVRYGPDRDIRGFETEPDRRQHPFRVGSRERKGARGWEPLATEGIVHRGGQDEQRKDWLEIDVVRAAHAQRSLLGGTAVGEAEETTQNGVIAPSSDPRAVQGSREETLRLRAEQRQMREEMAAMRKRIREIDAGGETAGDAQEELPRRMQILEELRSQGLITEEEYRNKRQELLEAL